MVDVMADVLRVAAHPASRTQILYAANLSYEQAKKYSELLVESGLLSKLESNEERRREIHDHIERGRLPLADVALREHLSRRKLRVGTEERPRLSTVLCSARLFCSLLLTSCCRASSSSRSIVVLEQLF